MGEEPAGAADIEWVFGALIAAGQDPDHLLSNYTFDQLGLFAKCVMTHQLQMVNLLVQPVLGTQGVGWKPHRVEGQAGEPQKGQHRNADYVDQGKKEAAMLAALSHAKIRMRTEHVSGGEDAGGSS